MRISLLLFVSSLFFVTGCQKEIVWQKPKLKIEKLNLSIDGVQVGSGEWIIKEGSSFQGVLATDAFLGDGYIQFKIIAGGPKAGFFNSALGYNTNNDWALQHDPYLKRLSFMENRQEVGELKDYSFALDYFRWCREDSTISLRHSAAENGSYTTIYTSKKISKPSEPIYFGGGTSGVGNGIVEVKIAGQELIKL